MKVFKKVLIIFFLIVVLAVSTLVYLGYRDYRSAVAALPVDHVLEQYSSSEGYVSYYLLPQTFIDATVSVEDQRYYTHSGVDVVSLLRALIADIKAGEFVQGGSTITQQLAKNLYFTQEKTLIRKISELFATFRLEKLYTKEEILELYVNTIYYGAGYYGIGEASRGYFHCDPISLEDYQSVLLAGLPNAPSVLAPDKNPDLALERMSYVLTKMTEQNYITEDESQELYAQASEAYSVQSDPEE